MAKTIIRFVIIGYGRIGKRHAAVLQQLPYAKLVAVCDEVTEQNTDSIIPFFASLSIY